MFAVDFVAKNIGQRVCVASFFVTSYVFIILQHLLLAPPE